MRARTLARMPLPRLTFLLLALAATSAGAQQQCEVGGEPVDTSIGSSTRGMSGLMRCRDAQGFLQREQELRDGRFVGLERFYRGGRLHEEHARNERGNKHGPAREFGADGGVLLELTYEDGRPVGLARSFHPGGKLRRVTFHGAPGSEQAHAEFTPAGQLAALRCGPGPVLAPFADDARLCGFTAPADVELFDAGGRVRARLRFEQGQAVRSETLHANGQPAATEHIEGERRIERRFDAQGRLQREQAWTGGQLAAERSYYLNGQPRTSVEWQRDAGKVQRVVRDFHDNGRVAAQGTYASAGRGRSLPIGAHERFDQEGRKRHETLYDHQGRATRERSWDADGTLARDDAVFEDGSRRAFTR